MASERLTISEKDRIAKKHNQAYHRAVKKKNLKIFGKFC